MKKRKITALLLIICLALAMFAPTAAIAQGDICLIAVNDTIDPYSLAYVSGSTVYVPATLFNNDNYSLGLKYQYDETNKAGVLYTATEALFFTAEETYDQLNYSYTQLAVFRNGVCYVPIALVCSLFPDLAWSYVFGSSNADVVRIRTGKEILDDKTFIAAAQTLIDLYYKAFISSGAIAANSSSGQTDPPSGSSGAMQIILGFTGLPTETMLENLLQRDINACFYLTAEEIRSAPDTVRRIVCEGHCIGANCQSSVADNFEDIQSLLFEVTRTKTLFCIAQDDETAAENASVLGVSYKSYNLVANTFYGWKYYNNQIDTTLTANETAAAAASETTPNRIVRAAILIPLDGEDSEYFIDAMSLALASGDYETISMKER